MSLCDYELPLKDIVFAIHALVVEKFKTQRHKEKSLLVAEIQ